MLRKSFHLAVAAVTFALFAPWTFAQDPPVESPPANPPATEPAPDTPKTDAEAPKPPRELQFSFRRTQWVDVLEWLAEQSDLSLVLDAPPPGSFNYSDSRKYTPTEAIDLVNGVLLSKGYTLVRQDRMLKVVSLADDVSRMILPRATLENIDERGKFEMVAVAFPIGKRNMETVKAEIQVLLGPYGKIDVLPASNQVLVTDRAGVMTAIDAVIKSIPEPQEPQKPPTKEPEKPELGVYALGGSDAEATIETLKALFEGARFVHDPGADHINAYATPSQHAAIKQIIAQMQEGAPRDNRPRMEIYPLPNLDPAARTEFLSNLALVAPTAAMRYDDLAERIFVWAAPKDQDSIRASIVKMMQVAPKRGSRVVQMYRLRRADPTTLSTLLTTTFPRATITVDAANRQVVVNGSAEDHEDIARLIQQLDADPPEDRRTVFQMYPVDRKVADRVVPLLARLVPEAEVTVDAALGQASVVATTEDHARIEPLLAKLAEAAANADSAKMAVVKIPHELRSRFASIRTLLDAEVPGATLMWNEAAGELTIWASPDDHARVNELLDQMRNAPPTKRPKKTLEVIPIPKESSERMTAIQPLLTTEVEGATITWDPVRLELTVWASPDDHNRVNELLSQIQQSPPNPIDRHLIAYPVTTVDVTSAVTTLQDVAPDAKLTPDVKGKRLLVWATPAEHAAIQKAIDALGESDGATGERSFMSHPVKGFDLALVSRLLGERFPNVTFEQDATRVAVIALATADEHAAIGEMLRQMRDAPDDDASRAVVVYPTDPASSDAVAQVLREMLPSAHVVAERGLPNVSVHGTEEEQALAQRVVDQWTKNRDEFGQAVGKVYALQSTRANDIRRQLYRLVPTAYFTPGATSHQLLVRATADEHRLIGQLIEQIDAPGDDSKTVAVYNLPGGEVNTMLGLLGEEMAEDIRVVPGGTDRVIVRATPEHHAIIEAALAKVAPAINAKPHTKNYAIDAVPLTEAAAVLRAIAPTATIVPRTSSRSLSVTALDEEHRLLKDAVATLNQGDATGSESAVAVIPLETAEPSTLVTLLQTRYAADPSLTFSYDAGTRAIMVVGPADRHAEIKAIVAAADGQPADRDRVVAVYPLGRIYGYTARQLIVDMLANERRPGTVTLEPYGNQLIVVADPRQQKMVREALERLQPDETAFEVFALDALDPTAAQTAISQLFSSAAEGGTPPIVDTDMSNYRIFVRGTPEQLKGIRELLVKMGETNLAGGSSGAASAKVRFIPLGGDADEAIDAVRNVWPRLRKNELKTLPPQNELRTPRAPAPKPNDTGWNSIREISGLNPIDLFAQVQAEGASDAPDSTSDAPQDGEVNSAEEKRTPPPVFIIPGERGVTIMSEDTAALEQLERLLGMVGQPKSRGGRRLTVFGLKNADATRLAAELNRFYQNIPVAARGGSGVVAFAADDRLNALVVFAGRGERAEIEELLEILDSDLSPELQATNQPVVIPLEHATASVVQSQLEVLYKTQLTAGGKQPALEIPTGANPIVAAMMQQINAVRQGPLMTIGVDEDTNSILVVAPPSLLKDVKRFTEELDLAASENSRRAVRIVPLKEINADEMDRALQRILRNRRGR